VDIPGDVKKRRQAPCFRQAAGEGLNANLLGFAQCLLNGAFRLGCIGRTFIHFAQSVQANAAMPIHDIEARPRDVVERGKIGLIVVEIDRIFDMVSLRDPHHDLTIALRIDLRCVNRDDTESLLSILGFEPMDPWEAAQA